MEPNNFLYLGSQAGTGLDPTPGQVPYIQPRRWAPYKPQGCPINRAPGREVSLQPWGGPSSLYLRSQARRGTPYNPGIILQIARDKQGEGLPTTPWGLPYI